TECEENTEKHVESDEEYTVIIGSNEIKMKTEETKLVLKVMYHAFHCKNRDCQVEKCKFVKEIVEHFKECNNGQCSRCNELKYYILMHAK
ncbi:hypothetical protein B4U79_19111, partial [Dinothrombium tinctorium]